MANPLPGLEGLPPLDSFIWQSMDIYSGSISFPPQAMNKRATAVPVQITGDFLESTRQRVQSSFAYSHVALCDPTVEVRDGYTGTNSAAGGSASDTIAIPTGQTGNTWIVVISFVTMIPGAGRRRVILLDRRPAPANWPTAI